MEVTFSLPVHCTELLAHLLPDEAGDLRKGRRKSLLKLTTTSTKSLMSSPTLCDPTDGRPTRLPRPWDYPVKNTGVGCHFLLQCMKVKSESEVAQSYLTLLDPMDCSLPGSSVHGIFQARVLEWGATAFSKLKLSKDQKVSIYML